MQEMDATAAGSHAYSVTNSDAWLMQCALLQQEQRALEKQLQHLYAPPPKAVVMAKAGAAASDWLSEISAETVQLCDLRRRDSVALFAGVFKFRRVLLTGKQHMQQVIKAADAAGRSRMGPNPAIGAESALKNMTDSFDALAAGLNSWRLQQRRDYAKLVSAEKDLRSSLSQSVTAINDADAGADEDWTAAGLPPVIGSAREPTFRGESAAGDTGEEFEMSDTVALAPLSFAPTVGSSESAAVAVAAEVSPLSGTPSAALVAAEARCRSVADAVRGIERAMAERGGDSGGWPADDAATFSAAVVARGRRRAQAKGDDEESDAQFASCLAATQLPLLASDAVLEHLHWHRWHQRQVAARRQLLVQWRAAKAVATAARRQIALSAEDAAAAAAKGGGKGGDGRGGALRPHTAPAAVRTASPQTRAAIAEWRAGKAADAERDAAKAAAASSEAAAVAAARASAWDARRAEELAAWREKQAEVRARGAVAGPGGFRGRGDGGFDGGGSVSGSEFSVGHMATPAAELAARAAVALEAAVAKRAAAAVRAEAIAAARRRRFGDYTDPATAGSGSSDVGEAAAAAGGGDGAPSALPRPRSRMSHGTRARYAYVPNDPTMPTAAAAARAATAADIGGSELRRLAAAAHEAAVPSQQPSARGRSFTYGVSAGALPSRATPAWRQVASRLVAASRGAL